MNQSIANSTSLAEALNNDNSVNDEKGVMHLNFFKSIGERQYLVELFIASIVLSLLLSLAEAQSWQNVQWGHVISYILYINWVI